MKKILLFSALIINCFNGISQCGTWRWSVKTLTDAQGQNVVSLAPVSSDVTTLATIGNAPHHLSTQSAADDTLPRQSSETKQVTIDCYVYKVKTNEGDHDYHLLLASNPDGSGDYMDGEIPDPTCPNIAGFSFLKAKYATARTVALNIKSLTDAGSVVHVQITGVPFWDALHGTSGGALNGREIHPILFLKILQ